MVHFSWMARIVDEHLWHSNELSTVNLSGSRSIVADRAELDEVPATTDPQQSKRWWHSLYVLAQVTQHAPDPSHQLHYCECNPVIEKHLSRSAVVQSILVLCTMQEGGSGKRAEARENCERGIARASQSCTEGSISRTTHLYFARAFMTWCSFHYMGLFVNKQSQCVQCFHRYPSM